MLSFDDLVCSAWPPMCTLFDISCVMVMPSDFHRVRALFCCSEFDLQMQCISSASCILFMAVAISVLDTPASFFVQRVSSINSTLRLSLVKRLEYAIMPIGVAVSSILCSGGG